MSYESLQQLRRLCEKFVSQWRSSCHHPVMKTHVLGEHIVDHMAFAGSMRWYHDYTYESANFGARVRGGSCHRRVYSKMTLAKWYLGCLNSVLQLCVNKTYVLQLCQCHCHHHHHHHNTHPHTQRWQQRWWRQPQEHHKHHQPNQQRQQRQMQSTNNNPQQTPANRPTN